ncbi:MAG TPA: AAA family ATPase [Alphaproteobacteria bacterium]|nr:AAA family ATPase [Alphaproteobacteria bacterium]
MHQIGYQPQGQSNLALKPLIAPKNWGNEEEFIKAMHQVGISFNGEVLADGTIHRFATEKKGQRDCWYVFYGMAGAFGDWKRDIHEKWSLKNNFVPGLNKEQLFEQIEKAKKAAEEEKQCKYEETEKLALDKWNSLSETGNSPYLLKKQVEAFGVRFNKDFLIIPLRDTSGKLWSLQWISPDGTKRFLTGGRKKGCFHPIGVLENGKPIIVTEGYATGASIHMATQQPAVIAFDAGNLEPVIEKLKKDYPKSPLLIAGDEDIGREHNTGRIKAEEAARKHNCRVVFPQFKTTETKPTDFNDLMLLEGLNEVSRQIGTALQSTTLKALSIRELLSMEIQPREMILNPIIPEQGLVMIHAPRGIGKTHVSLMIAYTVATGGHMFNGRWESGKPNKVLFVDGEMPLTVMQERLAKIVNSAEADVMHDDTLLIITPDLQNQGISDLSTPEGQQFVEEHLKDVKLLILDNHSALCRRGRENEGESWIPLQEWFLTLRRRGISVLLIHHSNKTGGQRGTSRKEDLLDTVITLRKPETYDPREGARFEVHYEKARGFYGEEAAPFEASLKEENGKFIWHVQKIENPKADQILTLHNQKRTQREIADELGLGLGTVNRRLKEMQERNALND